MAKHRKNLQEEQNSEQQPTQQYDTTFKDWIRKAVPLVLPSAITTAICIPQAPVPHQSIEQHKLKKNIAKPPA